VNGWISNPDTYEDHHFSSEPRTFTSLGIYNLLFTIPGTWIWSQHTTTSYIVDYIYLQELDEYDDYLAEWDYARCCSADIYVMKLIPETTMTTTTVTTTTTDTTTSTTSTPPLSTSTTPTSSDTKEETTTTTSTIPSISPWNLFEISSIFTLVIALLISKRQRKCRLSR
jgi:hypothetical protein